MEATTLTPVMQPPEAISVPGVISGTAIVADLLHRIGDKLAQSCDLRMTDAYGGYAAKVSIELQLLDCYPVAVNAQVAVGTIHPLRPSRHIDLGSEMTADEPAPSLERCVDGSLPEVDPRFRSQPSLERPIDPAPAFGTKAPRDFLSR